MSSSSASMWFLKRLIGALGLVIVLAVIGVVLMWQSLAVCGCETPPIKPTPAYLSESVGGTASDRRLNFWD